MDYSLGVWAEGVFSLTGECEHHPYSSMLQISSVPEGGDANGIISKWAVTTITEIVGAIVNLVDG